MTHSFESDMAQISAKMGSDLCSNLIEQFLVTLMAVREVDAHKLKSELLAGKEY